MPVDRRTFLKTASLLAAANAFPRGASAVGASSAVQLGQLVYPGGNWRPRGTALRRLAWEVHKRTAVSVALESADVKPSTSALSLSPFLYISGDRGFPQWSDEVHDAISRFIRLGGAILVDPAFTGDGDSDGFDKAFGANMGKILPGVSEVEIPGEHVLYRAFYKLARPVGRVEGPSSLGGYEVGGRMAVIRARHDLGGAWARDNLGSWEHDVTPGGERQRENAFRLGVNVVLYFLCLDYKNEKPHQIFNTKVIEE